MSGEPDEPRRGSVDRSRVRHLRRHEWQTAERLASHGHRVVLYPPTGEGRSADVTIDDELPHWELKSLHGSSLNTVRSKLRDATGQSSRVVLDITDSSADHDQARAAAQRAADDYGGLDIVRVVDGDDERDLEGSG